MEPRASPDPPDAVYMSLRNMSRDDGGEGVERGPAPTLRPGTYPSIY